MFFERCIIISATYRDTFSLIKLLFRYCARAINDKKFPFQKFVQIHHQYYVIIPNETLPYIVIHNIRVNNIIYV